MPAEDKVIRARARRVDQNQARIVAGLRSKGISVIPLNGIADILAGWMGRNYLLELKNEAGRNKLQPSQEQLRLTWRGQYAVVKSLDEALAVIGWEGAA